MRSRNNIEKKDVSRMLTVKDVQQIMGMSKNVVYKLVSQPDFPKISINGRYYIPLEDFQSWCKTYTGKNISI